MTDIVEAIAQRESEISRRCQVLETQVKRHPKGSLGLPDYIDQRRLDYCILAEAFDAHCLFGWVNIWPIARNPSDKAYAGSSIIRPEVAREREEETSPTGILVGAGLTAMDLLRTHGTVIGDIVWFTNPSVYRVDIAEYGGTNFWVYPMRAGDLHRNHDSARRVREGKQKLVQKRNDEGQLISSWEILNGGL